MTKLPDHFPADKLGVLERMQLEWFYTRYTCDFYSSYLFGHFMMAAYASLPAYLTPDLLYKMWQNFGSYEWGEKPEFIDSLAVSDVLLAPFCHEVSYELFQMEEGTRLSFQRWMNSGDPLWTNRKPYALEHLADFIESYHDRPNDTMIREGAKYRDDQLMEAKLYRSPQAAANYYLNKLKEASDRGDEQEILAIINALTKAKERQAYTNYSNDRTFIDLFPENQLLLWKHVLQHNTTTFASLLESTNLTGGNPLHLKVDGQSHAIQVNNGDARLVTKLDSLVEARNWMIIIGCSEKDEKNCSRFQDTLGSMETWKDWQQLTFTRPIGKKEFLKGLRNTVQDVTPSDNVVMYISALDAQVANNSLQVKYYGENIHEVEFSSLFSSINPCSFTLLLQCNYAPVNPLINTNKTGYALHTSSPQNLSADEIRRYGLESFATFTYLLYTTLSKHIGKLSHRQLHSEMIAAFGVDLVAPQLLSNRGTYYQQFASTNSQKDWIQHNLRLGGYLDKPASAGWDDEIEAAYNKFLDDVKLSNNREDGASTLDAKVAANSLEQKPVLLFVFSDPERTLPAIGKEIAAIKSVLRNSALDGFNEIKIMQNKSLKEVGDFVKSAVSRNRIQLFYYSGFNVKGWPTFGDGAMSLPLWCDWLAYQDNLELVVFNNSNSYVAASQLIQIGVGMAIGNDQLVTDEQSAAFGSLLMETIVKRGKLSDLPIQ